MLYPERFQSSQNTVFCFSVLDIFPFSLHITRMVRSPLPAPAGGSPHFLHADLGCERNRSEAVFSPDGHGGLPRPQNHRGKSLGTQGEKLTHFQHETRMHIQHRRAIRWLISLSTITNGVY